MTKRVLLGLLILATLPIYAADSDKLARLSFLIGTWDVDGAAGSATFERSLNNHVIVRKSWATVPAGGGKPASKHEDLLIIFPYGEHLRAAYYDSNGYVVGYEVQTPGKNTVVLVSDVMQGVPRARLTYTLGANGVLAAKIDVAPAGKPDAFAPSMAWSSRRK
jgi:hypothetical protein